MLFWAFHITRDKNKEAMRWSDSEDRITTKQVCFYPMEHNCFSNKKLPTILTLACPSCWGTKAKCERCFLWPERGHVSRNKAKLSFRTAYCNKSFLESGARKRRELFWMIISLEFIEGSEVHIADRKKLQRRILPVRKLYFIQFFFLIGTFLRLAGLKFSLPKMHSDKMLQTHWTRAAWWVLCQMSQLFQFCARGANWDTWHCWIQISYTSVIILQWALRDPLALFVHIWRPLVSRARPAPFSHRWCICDECNSC